MAPPDPELLAGNAIRVCLPGCRVSGKPTPSQRLINHFAA